ncbi:unnamed protein product, partial [Polarella glacialis]
VCDFDLLVAVDRYVAADAMKEVAIWDTIQHEVEYCSKIRGLYEFGEGIEVEDPIYGNFGDQAEKAAMTRTMAALQPAVSGLFIFLRDAVQEAQQQSGSGQEGTPDRALLQRAVEAGLKRMGDFDWNAPPMLSKREPAGTFAAAFSSDGLFNLDSP